jgi:hypothetical protein
MGSLSCSSPKKRNPSNLSMRCALPATVERASRQALQAKVIEMQMCANAERKRSVQEADKYQQEVHRLEAQIESLPAEPIKYDAHCHHPLDCW